jgi:hypothetical protein
MQSTLHALQALEATATALATAWELGHDAALLVALAWATRQLVALIRGVYQAGHASGVIWHRWGRPALLATTTAIAWVWSQIDWPTVWAVARDVLVVIVAGTVAAAQMALPALVAVSAALGRRYARLLGVQAPVAAVVGIAAVVPTRVAAAPAGKTKGTRARKAIAVATKADIPATRPTRAPHRRQQLALALELPA